MEHIILIGFKSAGKSSVGIALAKELKRPFIDLDEKIEQAYKKERGERFSCREIMKHRGESYFRKLEHKVLNEIITTEEPLVLALGGGAPLEGNNRKLIREHKIIEISAPAMVVFDRIMANGRPSFFPTSEVPLETFQRMWKEREPQYKKLADFTIENNDSIQDAVNAVVEKLNEKTYE